MPEDYTIQDLLVEFPALCYNRAWERGEGVLAAAAELLDEMRAAE